MKFVIIGDVHGRTIWKDIVKREQNVDKFIFLGDYLDPYKSYSPLEIYDNFMSIIDFKTNNPDKVILLVGNHDLSYIQFGTSQCRFSHDVWSMIGPEFRNDVIDGIFQFCYKIPTDKYNLYCTHAGMTNTWLRDNRLQIDEDELNDYFLEAIKNKDCRQFDFIDTGYSNCYGDDVYQSPLWVRPKSLEYDKPYQIAQIVGHTQGITSNGKNVKLINYCDTLESSKYWVLEEDDNSFEHPFKLFGVKVNNDN